MYCDIDTVYHKLISNLVFFCVDFQIEFLQSCQEQNKSRIDGPKKEKSTKEEIIIKNESHVVSYSTASDFMQNDHTSTSVSNVRVIHQSIYFEFTPGLPFHCVYLAICNKRTPKTKHHLQSMDIINPVAIAIS